MTNEEIYLFRVTQRMRQEELAREAGISQALLSQMECGYRVSDNARQKVIDAITRIKARKVVTPRKPRKSPIAA